MRLVPEARRLWHRLWSVRLAALSSVLGLANEVLPYLVDFIPPHLFAILSIAAAIAAALARLVMQETL